MLISVVPNSKYACTTPFFLNNIVHHCLGLATTMPLPHHHYTSICVREPIFEGPCVRDLNLWGSARTWLPRCAVVLWHIDMLVWVWSTKEEEEAKRNSILLNNVQHNGVFTPLGNKGNMILFLWAQLHVYWTLLCAPNTITGTPNITTKFHFWPSIKIIRIGESISPIRISQSWLLCY